MLIDVCFGVANSSTSIAGSLELWEWIWNSEI